MRNGERGRNRPSRLPAELSSFVGRRRELADVQRMLSRPGLVTLVGVGGVGKSRLALRAADRLDRALADGARMVELAALDDPALLYATVARGLGLPERSRTGPLSDMVSSIGRKNLLLVLDNCEHLRSGCASLVADLLPSCPGLRVLATSREPLGVDGEIVYGVPPLRLPDMQGRLDATGVQSEAERLFAERAQASVPGFRLTTQNRGDVARLCWRLDGIPLAIELTAVRLESLSLSQILARLEDRLDISELAASGRPARQRTIRATLDWSYDLLSEPERLVWRRLSVFAGGFVSEAAEAVCADAVIAPEQVRAALASLVNQSIVGVEERPTGARYRLLDVLRQYGRDHLRESGEGAALRRRHRDWCAALTRSVNAQWWGPEQNQVLYQLRAEHANVQVALEYCIEEPGEAEAGMAMWVNLWFFWHAHQYFGEARRWIRELLDKDPRPGPARAAALALLGRLLIVQGDHEGAATRLREAIEVGRRSRARATVAEALSRLGTALAARGEIDRALTLTDEGLRMARELNEQPTLPLVLFHRSTVLLRAGDPAAAVSVFEEGAALCRAAGERWVVQRTTIELAIGLLDAGHLAEARRLMRQGIAIAQDLGDERLVAWTVEGLAWVLAAEGRAEQAATLLGFAAASVGSQANRVYAPDVQRHERCRAAAIDQLGLEAFQAAYDRGSRLEASAGLALALGEADSPRAPRRRPAAPALTNREKQVVELAAQGLSSRAIAGHLGISLRTAENHINHVLIKLSLRSRDELTTGSAAVESWRE